MGLLIGKGSSYNRYLHMWLQAWLDPGSPLHLSISTLSQAGLPLIRGARNIHPANLATLRKDSPSVLIVGLSMLHPHLDLKTGSFLGK